MTHPCQQPHSEAFWKWFGMSQVRDGDGCPRVCYHGTPFDEPWTVWDRKIALRRRGVRNSLDAVGHWFTDSREMGEVFSGRHPDLPQGRVEEVFLKIEQPFIVGGMHNFRDLIDAAKAWPGGERNKMFGINHGRVRRWLKDNGNDGIWIVDAHLFWDPMDGVPGRFDYWVTLEPQQIKSTRNKGAWNPRRRSYLDG